MHPDSLIPKNKDYGRWLTRDYNYIEPTAAAILESIKTEQRKPSLDKDDLYTSGYEDGLADRMDSIRFREDAYKQGWADGEGDRIYS